MEQDAPTTFVRYRVVRGSQPVRLALAVLVNYRNFHGVSRAGSWEMQLHADASGVEVRAFSGAQPIAMRADAGRWTLDHDWHLGLQLDREAERGLDAQEDLLRAATLTVDLEEGQQVTLKVSALGNTRLPDGDPLERRQSRDRHLLERAGHPDDPRVRQLVLAADQFIVKRTTRIEPEGHTVIAGYPWFGDWGRDTMIALPGLALTTGRPEVARSVLRVYAQHVDRGMLPNRFVDGDEQPEYNTVDATLWYFETLRAYVQHTGDLELARDLWPVLEDIIEQHLRGTRYGIGVDRNDNLLRAGTDGVQLTWMDAKVGDWVVTPRRGKAIEINALWHNALCVMRDLARALEIHSSSFATRADAVAQSMGRFWNEDRDCCFDVLDGPTGNDPALRPNQLFAVSLPYSPLSRERQRAVVRSCARHLYTPRGMRSLSPEGRSLCQPLSRGSGGARRGLSSGGRCGPGCSGPSPSPTIAPTRIATAPPRSSSRSSVSSVNTAWEASAKSSTPRLRSLRAVVPRKHGASLSFFARGSSSGHDGHLRPRGYRRGVRRLDRGHHGWTAGGARHLDRQDVAGGRLSALRLRAEQGTHRERATRSPHAERRPLGAHPR